MTGPRIQADLFSIIVRFRKHKVVLTADIEKMYEQIKINEADRKFQRIVWRSQPQEPLRHYKLQTARYGTTSASYLATRYLKQLAIENEFKFPVIDRTISGDFYMDDLLTGAEDDTSATDIKKPLETISIKPLLWKSIQRCA